MNSMNEKIRDNWLLASVHLNFHIICPFNFEFEGIEMNAFAFLPNFGSANGMIVDLISPPTYSYNGKIVEWAKKMGCFYSFINVESYIIYDEDIFIETLQDWSKFNQLSPFCK